MYHSQRRRRVSIPVSITMLLVFVSLTIAAFHSTALPVAAQDPLPPLAPPIPPNDPARGLIWDGLELAVTGPCVGLYEVIGTDLCTHGPDPAPGGINMAQREPPLASPLVAPVQCDGDGVSGQRTQVIYTRASDVADRYNEYRNSFRKWASDVDSAYHNSAAETGGNRHVRFVQGPDCSLSIPHVVLTPVGDDNFGNTVQELQAQGYNRADRKYMVFLDRTETYCGLGNIARDDQPGPLNRNNNGPSYGISSAPCWNYAEAHEHMHNLGGVQLSAPHTSTGFHCLDAHDIMCYAEKGFNTQVLCPNQDFGRFFDCGHDDYYHTNPPAGSYLARQWNVANSPFLIRGPEAPRVAENGFSRTQGLNNWRYQDFINGSWRDIATYNARLCEPERVDCWHDQSAGFEGGYVWSTGMHPGPENDTARAWYAPRSGFIDIASHVAKANPHWDGVVVRITKNGATVWGPQYIAGNDTTGVDANVQGVRVALGDVIRFEVNRSGNYYSDSIIWNPTISYPTVENAGFESGEPGPWGPAGYWAIVKDGNARSGTAAARVGGGSAFYQRVTGLQPNTTYNLRGWAKAEAGNRVSIGVKEYNGNADFQHYVDKQYYQQLTLTFTTGASNTSALIYLWKSDGAGYGYGDDFEVTPVEVGNAGFEKGEPAPWGPAGYWAVVNNNARTGRWAARVAGGSAFYQTVPGLRPNTTYVVRGWAKAAVPGQNVKIGVKFYNNTGGDFNVPITSQNYQQVTLVFTTGATNTSVQIYLWKDNGGATDYAYGDDFEITPVGVANTGFERGEAAPWTTAGYTAIVTEQARSGTRAARVGGGSAFYQRVVGLQPNTTYALRGWAKADPGNRVSIGVKEYNGIADVQSYVDTSYYQQVTILFTTGPSNTSALIYLWKPDGAGYGYGDDFEVTLP